MNLAIRLTSNSAFWFVLFYMFIMPTDLNAIIFVIALALLPTGGSVYQRHPGLGILMMFASVGGILYSIRGVPELISLWVAIEETGIIETAKAVNKVIYVSAIVGLIGITVCMLWLLWLVISRDLRRRVEFARRRRDETYEPKKVGMPLLPLRRPRPEPLSAEPLSALGKPWGFKTLHDLREPLKEPGPPKESKP